MLNRYSRAAATAASILLIGTAVEPARSQGLAAEQQTAQLQTAQLQAAQLQTVQLRTVQSIRPASSSRQLAATPNADSYQTIYVNPDVGSDQAEGLAEQPVQTVTHALEIAQPNTVIVLAPGKYTQASGEVFPLQLKSGVTIQGTPGERNRTAIIEGGGNFNSPSRSQQNAAVVAADRAGIAQVAISNPDGYGVWIESASPTILESAFVGSRQTGIYVADGSPRVQGSYFSGNRIAGLVVFSAPNASIESNTFEGTGDAIRVVDGATPAIIGNRMTNNDAGLVLIGGANPMLKDNSMEGNRRNDVVEIAASTQGGLAALPALSDNLSAGNPSADNLSNNTTSYRSRDNAGEVALEKRSAVQPLAIDEPSSARLATNLTLSSSLPSENADSVPGDRLSLSGPSRPDEAAALDIRSRLAEQAAVEAPAKSRQIESRQTESRLVEQRQATLESIPSESISSELTESQPIEIANEADETNQAGLDRENEASTQADAVPGEILAGAPGAALAALQSGLPSGSMPPPIVLALGPRAVTGGNPDSPVLPDRDNRDRREQPRTEEEARPREIIRPNSNRLAVPSSSIPIGSGGSTTVFSPPGYEGIGSPPAPPSRAQSLGLYYRVFVDTSDPFVQDDIREVVPDSFRTRFEGRSVMQVGAFPTEEEAEERKELLERNNFDAEVEYIR